MRQCLLILGLLAAATPAWSQQTPGQAASNSDQGAASSSRRLLLQVLQTDSGVGGTNQFVYLRIFADGSVEYHPRRSQELKRERVTQGHISEEELAATTRVLEGEDVGMLSPMFKSTYTPIDFNWVLDFTIPRGNQSKRIKVVNFYPAMAVENSKAYPEALVRLVRKHFPTEMPDLSQDCRGFVGQS